LPNIGMGARALGDKALAYIANAKDGSGMMKMQEQNKLLNDQIEALRNEIKALGNHKKKKG